MPPALLPIRNQPVTLPVTVIRRSANDIRVGKIEARPKPSPSEATQSAAGECGHTRTTATLSKQMTRSPSRIALGRNRMAIGIANRRASVSAPQKAEVR